MKKLTMTYRILLLLLCNYCFVASSQTHWETYLDRYWEDLDMKNKADSCYVNDGNSLHEYRIGLVKFDDLGRKKYSFFADPLLRITLEKSYEYDNTGRLVSREYRVNSGDTRISTTQCTTINNNRVIDCKTYDNGKLTKIVSDSLSVDGKLVFRMSKNILPLRQTVDTSVAIHNFIYDNFRVKKEVIISFTTNQSDTLKRRIEYSYEYDSLGLLLYVITQSNIKTHLEWDMYGCLAKKIDYDLESGNLVRMYSYEYNKDRYLIKEIFEEKDKQETSYIKLFYYFKNGSNISD